MPKKSKRLTLKQKIKIEQDKLEKKKQESLLTITFVTFKPSPKFLNTKQTFYKYCAPALKQFLHVNTELLPQQMKHLATIKDCTVKTEACKRRFSKDIEVYLGFIFTVNGEEWCYDCNESYLPLTVDYVDSSCAWITACSAMSDIVKQRFQTNKFHFSFELQAFSIYSNQFGISISGCNVPLRCSSLIEFANFVFVEIRHYGYLGRRKRDVSWKRRIDKLNPAPFSVTLKHFFLQMKRETQVALKVLTCMQKNV